MRTRLHQRTQLLNGLSYRQPHVDPGWSVLLARGGDSEALGLMKLVGSELEAVHFEGFGEDYTELLPDTFGS